jgi:glycosyltransferase involved in cell wall biosynthesis
MYGGTERIVYYLTQRLVEQGHDVTLFASGDSRTKAKLIPGYPTSLRLDAGHPNPLAHHLLQIERVFQRAEDFDVIHMHMDYLPYSMIRRCKTPVLTTLHGRLDLPELEPIYEEFRDIPVVSISESQRTPLLEVNWQGTVYHGLPSSEYTLSESPGSYLAFLGRVSPEKGLDRALRLVQHLNYPLKIAAKIDPMDMSYFHDQIVPLLRATPRAEFLGEFPQTQKNAFLGNALALLFLIDWPEPFGLVMIEAMACGTPVIARPRGSVPEIIEHGVTGFLVKNEEEAMRAVAQAHTLDRRLIRRRFEELFLDTRMAEDYVALYRNILATPTEAVA